MLYLLYLPILCSFGNPLHPRRFHLRIWVKSLCHCLIYQGGAVFTQEFYFSFFDADEFVDLGGLRSRKLTIWRVVPIRDGAEKPLRHSECQ